MAGKFKKKKNQRLYLYATLIGVMLISIVGWVGYSTITSQSAKVAVNDSKGGDWCPKDTRKLSGHTIFVLDTTTRLNKTQVEDIKADVSRRLELLPDHHKVSVYTISDDYEQTTSSRFSLCVQKRFDEDKKDDLSYVMSFGKDFYDSAFESFVKDVSDNVSKSLNGKELDHSPILESLQVVTIDGFGKLALRGGAKKNLVLYSDLLHKTDPFSLYTTKPDYERFASTGYAAKVMPKLDGVDVSIRMLVDEKRARLQGEPLQTFWRKLIKDNNGKVVEFGRVQG